MECLPLAAVGVLLFVILLLCLKIHRMRADARQIAQALQDRLAADTNTLVDLSGRDRYMRRLATALNGQLRLLRSERQRYQNGDRQLKEAVTNISHDLRTPLTSILGYLQLMGREDISPEEYRHCLEIVEGRAKVLQDLITSFYDLSRIEGGEYPLELQSVDLRRSLEPLLAGFYEDFEQAGFQVTVELMFPEGSTMAEIFEKLEENGIQDVIDEMQRQIDSWRESL